MPLTPRPRPRPLRTRPRSVSPTFSSEPTTTPDAQSPDSTDDQSLTRRQILDAIALNLTVLLFVFCLFGGPLITRLLAGR
jgi:hypothetical protein